jgi:putative SOS response-associated peptidase YedK
MCGRYANNSPSARAQRQVARELGVPAETVAPRQLTRTNIAPTTEVLVAVNGERGREARKMRWGLAPAWGKLRGGPTLINARSDKLLSSNAWKPLIRTAERRCLIAATGWLEWLAAEAKGQPRQPFYHRLPEDEPSAFAGLWTIAKPKDADEPLASCTIITIPATAPEITRVHDRQPAVLLGRERLDAWLDESVDAEDALALIEPLPADVVEVWPVDPRINKATEQGAELLEPDSTR